MEGVRRSSQRQEVIGALRLLCDRDVHEQWRNGQATWPDFTEVVHGLIDDTWLDHRPASELIPAVLVDEEEADAVDRAAAALVRILDDLGPTSEDAAYLSHPGWPDVVTTASDALRALDKHRADAPDIDR